MLHLAFTKAGLQACAQRLVDEDHLVLVGDATYEITWACQQISESQLHILADDAKLRGVEASSSVAISYREFVQLCVDHHPVASWGNRE